MVKRCSGIAHFRYLFVASQKLCRQVADRIYEADNRGVWYCNISPPPHFNDDKRTVAVAFCCMASRPQAAAGLQSPL